MVNVLTLDRRRTGGLARSEVCGSGPVSAHPVGRELLHHRSGKYDWHFDDGTVWRVRTAIDRPNRRTGWTYHHEPTIINILNLSLFRPDIHFGAVVEALQNKNLLQILAEPNLIAVNGKEASFLAGGQFPFPIVQPGEGFTAVTISFKEFGVSLGFTPVIMPNGNIHLAVIPEVSSLDFTNAFTISGFTVPALSTRRAETEFELKDGQSFVIAGLIDNRVTNIFNKCPA